MFRSRPFSRRYPALLLLAVALSATLSSCQSMPEGLSVSGPVRSAERLEILRDQTYQNAQGTDLVDQEIFDEAFRLIAQARRLVVVDMFLFNAFAGEDSYRPLSEQLTKALISAKQRHPDMPAVMITDPFNTLYGGLRAPELEQLRAAGAHPSFLKASLPATRRKLPCVGHFVERQITKSPTGSVFCLSVGSQPERYKL